MLKLFASILGVAFLVIGFIALLSPIPIGLIFITLGISILICVSPKTRTLVKGLRHKHAGIDKSLTGLERRLNNRIQVLSNALVETRPSHQPQSSHSPLKDDQFH